VDTAAVNGGREKQKGERHKTGILWGEAPYALGEAALDAFSFFDSPNATK